MTKQHLAAIAALTFTSTVASHAGTLTGLWEFDDELNLGYATVGTDLLFLGAAPGMWSAGIGDDFGTPLLGVIITPPSAQANQIIATHGIAPNGGGLYVNEWSFLVDVFSPAGSRDSWRSLVQTNQSNTNDLDYGIRPDGDAVGLGSYGYSPFGMDETRWSRLVVTWSLPLSGPAFVNTYIDGALFYSHPLLSDASDGRFALDPTLQFFSDEDGENAPLNVAALAIFDGALSASEVSALGAAGSAVPEPGTAALLVIGSAVFCRRRRR